MSEAPLPVTTHSVPDWIRRAARRINDISQNGVASQHSGSSAFDLGDSGTEGGGAMDLGASL